MSAPAQHLLRTALIRTRNDVKLCHDFRNHQQFSPANQKRQHPFGKFAIRWHQEFERTPARLVEHRTQFGEGLETLMAVADVPLYAEAWACLSGVYCNEFMFGLDGDEASLELALDAAKKALQITPDSVMGMYAIALAYFYKAEKTLFFDYAEKVISAASFRVDVLATIGLHTAYAGNWEQGMGYLHRAAQLNRNHPTWYWFPFAANFYRLSQYEEALTAAMKLNMPEFDWEALFLSAIHGQLGNLDKSKQHLNQARTLKPALFKNLEGYVGRIFKDDAFKSHFLDGLRLANPRLT
ncbi:MAG: tetratricopeptide repeat protein [Rugosibacter sp.]|nr:tetratricopeptide repeat protein [Rugosibacter sp.]